MGGIEEIIRGVRQELDGELRERVRRELGKQPKEWLVEQLLRQVLGKAAAPAPALPAQRAGGRGQGGTGQGARSSAGPAAATAAGTEQALDEAALTARIARFRQWDRERLESGGLLLGPPPKGTEPIGSAHRSPAGEELLREAKDLLHALLFGTAEEGVRLKRVEQELLTMTLPRHKAQGVASVLRAATEIGAEGTWRDPEGRSDDERAANVVLEVEYGETASELVGSGIAACLRLINNLEVNEQVLYARMQNVEESTLA